ncbi:hypothetical protein QJS66_06240 [Kocuria rhizophila]|nr:hypothetical protein QJS66_06240 [Kocuria rhizophila]
MGVPDEKHGEEVGAVVCSSPVLESKGNEALTRGAGRLRARNGWPSTSTRVYHVTDELPKGPAARS